MGFDKFDVACENTLTAPQQWEDERLKTAGTDIAKLMPSVSRFGGGNSAKKKQGVIDKLKTFFEKPFGIDGSASFMKPEEYDTV